MSFNQSRSDRSENQYRRAGRSASFNPQRTNSGSFPKAGGSGPAPSLSLSSNRSFKNSSNAQGGQSRVKVSTENSSLESSGAPAPRGVQNGAQAQPQSHGVSDAPAAKPTNSSAAQRSARNVLRVASSQSQSASVSSETMAPTTSAKAPGDASKPFPFQFGSISPGVVNGMQIPTQTSSAPPNLDEQKRDKLQRKDVGAVEQSNTGDAPPIRKAKKETQVSSAPPATQMKKPSVLPVPGIPMPVPFHQSQVSVQFGGPNTQMQSHAMTATSLQMPMPLPMGSAPQVQQFVPVLPPHPLQPQGIMHQRQGLSYTSRMGPQLPPQLGNLGIGITPQYPQQQGGNFGGQRKTTVKITHPETHEELKLDKRTYSYTTGPRSHPNVPPQFQPMPPFAPSHPINYYSNSYNTVQSTVVLGQQSAFASTLDDLEATSKYDGEGAEFIGGGLVSAPVSGSKDRPIPELNRQKSSTTSRGKKKKKRKEILQKADSTGTTSDLYMAFKGPEEKKETFMHPESIESTSAIINSKQAPADALQEDALASKKVEPCKAEPYDWEDADINTPKLETSVNGEQVDGGLVHHDKDGNGNVGKKYSRDFLLIFAGNLVDRDSYPFPIRVIDRPSGGSKVDRRGAAMVDEDRWSNLSGAFGLGRDLRVDIGYGGNAGFRPDQGGNYAVLRNPRAQTPVQYAGGILYGPLQSIGSQAGMQRSSPDANRWLRGTNFQKGLLPTPQTPLQMMHKAERKYEVGKVTDAEQAKQRQLKGILNKLTPQNFEKLLEQVKAVNIDNARTLSGVISQIFDKSLMEPTFCEMYANFCHHLAGELPNFSQDNEKITFKQLLRNKCQEEFERGEREQEEANKVDEEGGVKQSEEEREENRIEARRRMLGNIRLIGELYKKRMLTERIMHECIKKVLGQYQNPDEDDIEALCKLMSNIGEMIDHPNAKQHMDAYFDMMAMLSSNLKLSSRVRFMLRDAIDLRKNKWQQRRKVEGPRKIEEVH